MDLNLRGKTALITGASKGIGRASAEILAEEGVNVILVSRTQADLDAVRDSIASRCNVRAEVHAFNLADSIDFEVGGYGDDGHDRADLVRFARERAEAKYGTSFAGKRTFIIGDTPHDITGAHGAGAYAIGVATGGSSADELKAAGADLVVSGLTELDALRGAILGRV